MSEELQEKRKMDHIDLALAAQINLNEADKRFYYEPMLAAHPNQNTDLSLNFLGKKLNAPLWISSMTGGVGPARHINQNLAKVCAEFKIGLGLGSCRVLLTDDTYFADFNLRPIMGNDLPLFANLGIAQVESLIAEKKQYKITELTKKLEADGLIVHINPLQEWFQPEGDRFLESPISTIARLRDSFPGKIIIKEVGQGMGPKSLEALLNLSVDAIELAGLGGTNFTKLEQIRGNTQSMQAFSNVGHSSSEMISFLNNLLATHPHYRKTEIIISGGIKVILDGVYLRENLAMNSVIGQAKNYLAHAENYDDLFKFTEGQIMGLKIAKAFLVAKPLNKDSL